MDQASTLQSAFNIIKRLHPAPPIGKNVAAVMNLIDDQDTRGELLSRVDQPLVVGTDPKNGYDYLKCEYNRDNKSYRSPWSNVYYQKLFKLTTQVLKQDLENKLNQIFKYTSRHFEQPITAAYVWESEDENGQALIFQAACFSRKRRGLVVIQHIQLEEEYDNQRES